jgi:parallel beta-helix repeat protein
MAQDIINLTPGSTPITPNISALIGVGDPNLATTDTDLTGAATGSLFVRRDGSSGAEWYQKYSSAPTWRVNAVTPVFDVRVYGAAGDGTTDDTSNLQAALTAATGATAYIPPGTYKVTNTLFLPANTVLQLAAGATMNYQGATNAGGCLSVGTGCAVRGQSAATSIIQCSTRNQGISVSSNCVISDVQLLGDSGTSGTEVNAIKSGNATDVVVQRCWVLNWFSFGINGGGTSARWTITDNFFESLYHEGVYSGVGSTDFVISHNHLKDIGGNGIDLNGINHVVANNWLSHIGYNYASGSSDFWGILLQPIAGPPEYDVSNCVVSGNRVDNCSGPGITLRAASGANCSNNVVTGNVVTGSGGGITIDCGGGPGSLDRNAIVGNVVRGNPNGAGIVLYGVNATSLTDTLIANNVVTANGTALSGAQGIVASTAGTTSHTQILHNVALLNSSSPGTEANQIDASANFTMMVGNKTETTDNDYKFYNQPLHIDGPASSQNKVIFIQTYDSNPSPHAIRPDTSSTVLEIQPSGGKRLHLDGSVGVMNLIDGGAFQISGKQVVGPQIAGYGTPTGGSRIANFPGATATLVQTSEMLAQLLIDLKTHGLIGT